MDTDKFEDILARLKECDNWTLDALNRLADLAEHNDKSVLQSRVHVLAHYYMRLREALDDLTKLER